MTEFEYFSALMSVLLAIGMAEILSGWGRLARSAERVRIYPLFLFWSVFLVFMAINIWTQYWGYRLVEFAGYKVLLLLTQVFALVFAAYQLTPNAGSASYDMEAEYWRLSRVVFPTIGVMFLSAIPAVIVAAELTWTDDRTFLLAFSASNALIAMACWSLSHVKRVWYHWSVAVFVAAVNLPTFFFFQLQ